MSTVSIHLLLDIFCLSRGSPLVPWLVGILIGLGIALLGTETGGSLNPARQFGPAVSKEEAERGLAQLSFDDWLDRG
jgi:glycerol uptake facilitator-like aquaporin